MARLSFILIGTYRLIEWKLGVNWYPVTETLVWSFWAWSISDTIAAVLDVFATLSRIRWEGGRWRSRSGFGWESEAGKGLLSGKSKSGNGRPGWEGQRGEGEPWREGEWCDGIPVIIRGRLDSVCHLNESTSGQALWFL